MRHRVHFVDRYSWPEATADKSANKHQMFSIFIILVCRKFIFIQSKMIPSILSTLSLLWSVDYDAWFQARLSRYMSDFAWLDSFFRRIWPEGGRGGLQKCDQWTLRRGPFAAAGRECAPTAEEGHRDSPWWPVAHPQGDRRNPVRGRVNQGESVRVCVCRLKRTFTFV